MCRKIREENKEEEEERKDEEQKEEKRKDEEQEEKRKDEEQKEKEENIKGVDIRRRRTQIFNLGRSREKWQEDSVPQRNINPHIPRILFRGETNNQEDLKARRIAPEPDQYTTIYIA
ncbi:hypothetical protein M8J75_003248 [Diaphorina citri]|nr:hypothetical protein M8J75_003248 [Diaphorina citri]